MRLLAFRSARKLIRCFHFQWVAEMCYFDKSLLEKILVSGILHAQSKVSPSVFRLIFGGVIFWESAKKRGMALKPCQLLCFCGWKMPSWCYALWASMRQRSKFRLRSFWRVKKLTSCTSTQSYKIIFPELPESGKRSIVSNNSLRIKTQNSKSGICLEKNARLTWPKPFFTK